MSWQNNVDPDQMVHFATSAFGLHYLPKCILWDTSSDFNNGLVLQLLVYIPPLCNIIAEIQSKYCVR